MQDLIAFFPQCEEFSFGCECVWCLRPVKINGATWDNR
jgi:hypothetical protein